MSEVIGVLPPASMSGGGPVKGGVFDKIPEHMPPSNDYLPPPKKTKMLDGLAKSSDHDGQKLLEAYDLGAKEASPPPKTAEEFLKLFDKLPDDEKAMMEAELRRMAGAELLKP